MACYVKKKHYFTLASVMLNYPVFPEDHVCTYTDGTVTPRFDETERTFRIRRGFTREKSDFADVVAVLTARAQRRGERRTSSGTGVSVPPRRPEHGCPTPLCARHAKSARRRKFGPARVMLMRPGNRSPGNPARSRNVVVEIITRFPRPRSRCCTSYAIHVYGGR